MHTMCTAMCAQPKVAERQRPTPAVSPSHSCTQSSSAPALCARLQLGVCAHACALASACTRQDHGAVELALEPVSIRRTVEACMDIVALEAQHKGLALAYSLDPLLASNHLMADPIRLRQVRCMTAAARGGGAGARTPSPPLPPA